MKLLTLLAALVLAAAGFAGGYIARSQPATPLARDPGAPATFISPSGTGADLVASPRQFYFGADGTHGFGAIRWVGWGAPTATGAGVASITSCTPDCATGPSHLYPASLIVTDPVICGRRRIYALIVVVYDGTEQAQRLSACG